MFDTRQDVKITVSKIRNFVQRNKIDILGIDGITYLTDERYQRGDSRTTMLTNISEDLMSLSIELKIPILVVVQSNRSGVNKDSEDTPDLENIKDSDGIGANATKVIAIKQKVAENIIQLSVKKHRDGKTGQTLLYQFDFDTGTFTYVPSNDDGLSATRRNEKITKIKKEFEDESDVF